MNQTNTSKRIPTQINEFRGDYAFLSNFYPAPVSYMGQTYANNEAAFQAQKTLSAREQRKFCIFGCIILLMQRNSAEILHYARTGKK
ncbi:hypothetical protein [Blautia obeum]|uniref:hypothetical protein n=1 Tax=Blautia obeum TaxID=40520 RepID=UPI001FC8394F|nr:hypothetical protein [Blautia obeum]